MTIRSNLAVVKKWSCWKCHVLDVGTSDEYGAGGDDDDSGGYVLSATVNDGDDCGNG